MSMSKKRTLVMITGAGASVSFGFPSTSEITTMISASLRNHRRISSTELSLYETVHRNLRNYLKPGVVTFEDIYQSIQDVTTLQSVPKDSRVLGAFRPRVGATHVLRDELCSYSDDEGSMLQHLYLNNILDSFLNALANVSGVPRLAHALKSIQENFLIWSFTLNYDNIISNIFSDFTSGFSIGNAPRFFRPDRLLSALDQGLPIHSHLHGSLKWGFPTDGSGHAFELHEFDSPTDGVRYSKSRPSARPVQRGETLPSSPIITGLDKTELVFRQPFFANFLAFFRSLGLCSDLLIAGYGFRDRHVNMGIEECRHRLGIGTYIVDKDSYNRPSSYFKTLTPDALRVLLPGDAMRAKEITEYPGWWKLPGIRINGFITAPIFLWLQGFDTFCDAVANNGLPAA